jgi:hypothetical protein
MNKVFLDMNAYLSPPGFVSGVLRNDIIVKHKDSDFQGIHQRLYLKEIG